MGPEIKFNGHTIVDIPLSISIISALLAPHVAAIRTIEIIERSTWLDRPANLFQKWLLKFSSLAGGHSRREAGDGLTEPWLGHSFHPILADVPIGAWTGTMILDLAWLTNANERVTHSADLSLVLGLLGAAGATVTGAADWSHARGAGRRAGLLHGLLYGIAMLAYLGSSLLRLRGKRRAGIALSTTGYLTSLFSAYVGGELVFIIHSW